MIDRRQLVGLNADEARAYEAAFNATARPHVNAWGGVPQTVHARASAAGRAAVAALQSPPPQRSEARAARVAARLAMITAESEARIAALRAERPPYANPELGSHFEANRRWAEARKPKPAATPSLSDELASIRADLATLQPHRRGEDVEPDDDGDEDDDRPSHVLGVEIAWPEERPSVAIDLGELEAKARKARGARR